MVALGLGDFEKVVVQLPEPAPNLHLPQPTDGALIAEQEQVVPVRAQGGASRGGGGRRSCI